MEDWGTAMARRERRRGCERRLLKFSLPLTPEVCGAIHLPMPLYSGEWAQLKRELLIFLEVLKPLEAGAPTPQEASRA